MNPAVDSTIAGAGVSSSLRPPHTAPSSTEGLAEWLRESSAKFRIAGAGTWMTAGRPVSVHETLSTSGIAGVVEYVPGDLTMTVRAGTSLSELDAITLAEGQWLGIDPAGSAHGTIGATVATAATGPLAHGIGRMRDIVLGLEVVTGDGRITRSGGKVVKNVAGYDLVRLQTGAWGSLGIITEVSLRLRALPEVDETVAITLDTRKPVVAHLVALRDLTIAPLALELIDGALARLLGVGNETALLVRLGGNETRVRAQRNALATLGSTETVSAGVWQSLRGIDSESAALVRLSHLPSELAATWAHVHDELSVAELSPALLRATVSRGVIRAVVPQPPDMGRPEFAAALAGVARTIIPPGGHAVWEQLPADAWNAVPSAVADPISTGLQRAFDPARRCNPGILGTPLS